MYVCTYNVCKIIYYVHTYIYMANFSRGETFMVQVKSGHLRQKISNAEKIAYVHMFYLLKIHGKTFTIESKCDNYKTFPA